MEEICYEKTGIKFLASMAVAVSLLGSVTLPQLKVSARAEGHYSPGVFRAEVSDYPSLRSSSTTNSPCVYKIPAKSMLVITSVDLDTTYKKYRRGKVKYIFEYSKGSYKKVPCTGWVNLEYADELYDYDLTLGTDFTTIQDYVPEYYYNVTWRKEKSPYSAAIGLLYHGFKIYRYNVTDKTIDENDKMSMFSTYISGNTFGNYVYNDGVGYYNLDYMGSDVKLFEY